MIDSLVQGIRGLRPPMYARRSGHRRGCWSVVLLLVVTGSVAAQVVGPGGEVEVEIKPADTPATAAPADPVATPADAGATPPADSAAQRLAQQQELVAEKYRRLEMLMLRMAEVDATNNPRRAALLKQALAKSKAEQTALDLRELIGLIQREELQGAVDRQTNVREDLRVLLDLLQSENRADRLKSEQQRVRDYIQQLDRILRQQRGIQGRTEGGDDAQRLANEQGRVAERTGELSKEIQTNERVTPANPPSDGPTTPGPESPAPLTPPTPQQNPPTENPSDGKRGGEAPPGQTPPGESPPTEKSPTEEPAGDKPADTPSDEKRTDEKPAGEQPSAEEPSGKPSSDEKPSDEKPAGEQPAGTPAGETPAGEESPGSPSAPTPGAPPTPPSDSNSPPSDANPSEGTPSPPPAAPAEDFPGRPSIDQAQQKMRDAAERLQKAERNGALEAQKEARRLLEQAKAELEEILRQMREEEVQRTLADLESRCRKMLEWQIKVYEDTKQLDALPPDQKAQQLVIQAGKLGIEERKILVEAEKALLLLREEGSSVAFPEALEQIQADVAQTVDRLGQAKIDALTLGLEEDIVAALEEIVAAFQRAQQEAEKRRQQPNSAPPGQQPQEESPLVDAIAELKMIRTLQVRVNKRTETYAQQLTDPQHEIGQAMTDDLQSGLRELSQRELRIHQLTRDIVLGKNQ